MKLLSPQALPYNFDTWKKQPFHIRTKMVCQAWAVQGAGAPLAVYSYYFIKIVLYILLWTWFASFSTDLGTLRNIDTWWFKPEALLKAILWSMLFEGLGLASGSGPLSGRYKPSFGGILYFLRPNTIKFPFIPGMPLFGGDKRRWIDCLLYLLHMVQLVRVRASFSKSTWLRDECKSIAPCDNLTNLANPPVKIIFLTGCLRMYFNNPPAKSPISRKAASGNG